MIEKAEVTGMNARQTMLHFKGAHGKGHEPTSPKKNEIDVVMQGCDDEYKVTVYCDGTYPPPLLTKSCAAMGGIWELDA